MRNVQSIDLKRRHHLVLVDKCVSDRILVKIYLIDLIDPPSSSVSLMPALMYFIFAFN